MSSPTPILLLKTRSSPHDGYEEFFSHKGYRPSFIPVLEHRFHTENLARVRGLFASGAFETGDSNADGSSQARPKGDQRKYGGMIFTSQRAVEGFAKMIEEDGLPLASPSTTPLILYTVGPATARSLTTLRDTVLPAATIHGADAGNGENLAHLILQHYNARYLSYGDPAAKPALLFLVGEQRRDIIPKTLMDPTRSPQHRIQVDETVVYETAEMDSFERDFDSAVRGSSAAPALWVAVFSPTGCEAMLRVLGLGPFARESTAGAQRVFVASIGPTTRDHLRSKFGFEVDVCAEKPSPEGVEAGIRRFMESR
ncbi:Tetrapyrrole biosynthesis uroporphyrinogen III synthase [Penicillium hispanicum]|uniref:Tetrapyrrole biosynthesis uroporphyrinogen III synthase n=1 Tax=Penicillium hispanicum TaxID=1080232 RepID=UPI002541A1A6|nr:Tetrapyrrole biosynthesis uroporphyrinogen III synthase [Penicillium hispanicum]KAJ5570630.1 Tetrapyrrole biosynthesis uroporphyrinogen III synthase [Penicillium hispanicum]